MFLIKGLTLPGATDGIMYYLKPDFSLLTNWQVRHLSASQVAHDDISPVVDTCIPMSYIFT